MKRIYEDPLESDGIRILVDRLWPRGMTKDAAKLDDWYKDIAPSHALRKWFAHDIDKFAVFKVRYAEELKEGKQLEMFTKLTELVRESEKPVTLLYATKEETHNHVVILCEMLEKNHR